MFRLPLSSRACYLQQKATAEAKSVHTFKEFALQSYFSLTARTQALDSVKTFIRSQGLCEHFRTKFAVKAVTLEIVEAMVMSLLTRENILSHGPDTDPAPPAKDVSLLFHLLDTFVSEEEMARFKEGGEASRTALRDGARDLIPALAGCFGLPPLDSPKNKVNRILLKKSLQRRIAAFKEAMSAGRRPVEENPSNTTVLAPSGYRQQPFLSLSGTETVFSHQTWRDWVREM